MTTTNQRAVEEVAKVLALVQNGHPDNTPQPTADAFWGLLDDNQRDRYRRMATAANKRTPGWRPISEAPRDGSVVWLASDSTMRLAYWRDGERFEHRGFVGGGWRDHSMSEAGTRSDMTFDPTMWHPVPTLPPPPGGAE